MTYDVEIGGRVRRVDVERAAGEFTVTIDGQRRVADVTVINGVWSLILAREPGDTAARSSHEVAIVEQPAGSGSLTVHVDGRLVSATVGGTRAPLSPRGKAAGSGVVAAANMARNSAANAAPNTVANTAANAAANTAPQRVIAPMPGKVVKVLVKPGDVVAARQGVIVVEAMKMENELRSPKAGTVAEIKVAEGASVEAGAILAVIE